jgi:hypothetical protein
LREGGREECMQTHAWVGECTDADFLGIGARTGQRIIATPPCARARHGPNHHVAIHEGAVRQERRGPTVYDDGFDQLVCVEVAVALVVPVSLLRDAVLANEKVPCRGPRSVLAVGDHPAVGDLD